MRDNTTGPVRDDRTQNRRGGSTAPAFSQPDPRVPGAPGEQRPVDDAAARREPLTEPVPAAAGIPRQDGTAARHGVAAAEQAGVALPRQTDDPKKGRDDLGSGDGTASAAADGRRDGQSSGRDGASRAATDKANGKATDKANDKANDKADGPGPAAKPEEQLDGTPMPVRVDDADNTDDKPDTDKANTDKAADGKGAPTKPTDTDDTGTVLFGEDVATGFRTRWRELQADFVDDPKRAVQGADELVDEVLQSLTKTLTEHKQGLAGGWQDQGETEELRQALRKYRSFLDQLLKN